MKDMVKRLAKTLKVLHRDQQGANMVEYILIIAAIGLPLMGLLFYFRSEIATWVGELWDSVKSGEKKSPSDFQ